MALKGKPYCHAHARLHRLKAAPPSRAIKNVRLPALIDHNAIQVARALVTDALCSARIDARHAGLLFYAIEIASQNVDSADDIVPADTGEESGPEKHVCDPDNSVACPQTRRLWIQ
jgi:hypothetical protein